MGDGEVLARVPVDQHVVDLRRAVDLLQGRLERDPRGFGDRAVVAAARREREQGKSDRQGGAHGQALSNGTLA